MFTNFLRKIFPSPVTRWKSNAAPRLNKSFGTGRGGYLKKPYPLRIPLSKADPLSSELRLEKDSTSLTVNDYLNKYQALKKWDNTYPTITSLNLEYCSRLTDTSIQTLIEALGPKLRDIKLKHCTGVTDEVMLTIAECCPDLIHLDVRHTPIQSTESIMAIVKKCRHLNSFERDTTQVACVKTRRAGLETLRQSITHQRHAKHAQTHPIEALTCCII